MTVSTPTGQSAGHTIPIGSIIAWHNATAPSGWLLCNNQQVAIATYPELYNILTTNATTFPYGANTNGSGAAGATHFLLPNLAAGYFTVSPSLVSPTNAGRNANVGTTAGAAHTHTWTTNLGVSASGSSSESHTATMSTDSPAYGGVHSLNVSLPQSAGATNAGANGNLNTAYGAHNHATNSASGSTDGHAGHGHGVNSVTSSSVSHSHNYNASGGPYTPTATTNFPPYLTMVHVILAKVQERTLA